jgi:hypothetical protein
MDLSQLTPVLLMPVPAYFVLGPLGVLFLFLLVAIFSNGNKSTQPVVVAQPAQVPQQSSTNTFVAPPAPPLPPIPQELAAQPVAQVASVPQQAPAFIPQQPVTSVPPTASQITAQPQPQVQQQTQVIQPQVEQGGVAQTPQQSGWKTVPQAQPPVNPQAPIVA